MLGGLRGDRQEWVVMSEKGEVSHVVVRVFVKKKLKKTTSDIYGLYTTLWYEV